MDGQPRMLLDEPRLRSSVALVERFDDLLKSVAWVQDRVRREHRDGLSRCEWEVAVTVAGILAAGRKVSSGATHAWREPAAVLLKVWSPDLVHREDVNAPQVAAACLGGPWSPRGAADLPPTRRWEPARLVLMAIVYKSVHSGMHRLAANVPPLARERSQDRDRFNEHIWRGTHAIAGRLTALDRRAGDDGPTIRHWECEEHSLWEFVASAILGPGRPGAGGCAGRPLPGAYTASLLGQWCKQAIGVFVGTVEAYVCIDCEELYRQPSCPAHPSAVVIATSCQKHFVTPRQSLTGGDDAWGHEQVKRKTCNNGTCIDRLHVALHGHHLDSKPIYPASAPECPYCHTDIAGQRPTTVWTRFP